MPKPLRSEIKNPPNRQFAHFGVLDAGQQSRGAFFGSIVTNVVLALLAVIIGASVKKTVDNRKHLDLTYVKPLEKLPDPPKPKLPPPPKLPPVPKVVKVEEPKIKLPEVKIPDPPKPIAVAQPKPVPVVTPAPPKMAPAAVAPKVVAVKLPGQDAAIKNNSTAPPAPVSLGRVNSPVPTNLSGPAVSPVRLNAGMSGMPPGAGVGKPSAVNLGGNGSPSGQMGGTRAVAVTGLPHGVTGGTGTNGNGTGVQVAQVKLPGQPVEAARPVAMTTKSPVQSGPQVLFKPKPEYTAEATAQHVEGTVRVRIRVSSSGAVTVLGVASGLGHGLDESALRCAQGIRFKPAMDASGNPTEWEGTVNITFQIA